MSDFGYEIEACEDRFDDSVRVGDFMVLVMGRHAGKTRGRVTKITRDYGRDWLWIEGFRKPWKNRSAIHGEHES